MKVLLRRNVAKLGVIGDVVVVRDGYARNCLIPQGLATVPSEANLRAIDREKETYLAELTRQKVELETQARLLHGKEFTISARANEEGRLYGSVGPAQIAAAVVKTGLAVDPEQIALDEPIHKLDKYEVTVQFGEDVEAKIVLWVVPTRDSDVPELDPRVRAKAEAKAETEAAEAEQAEEAEGDQPAPAEEEQV